MIHYFTARCYTQDIVIQSGSDLVDTTTLSAIFILYPSQECLCKWCLCSLLFNIFTL